jgi:segregation and condensation protein B
MIIESGDLAQIGVRPQYMTPIMAIRTPKAKRLSDAALETIAIIAMKQPCTRKEIEDMRQKDSEGTIATLLEARLFKT